MAADERDRRFDKALARHLRSAAPTGEAANRSTAPLSPYDACPDAETLAAYHERSLLPDELNSWKSHLVGCARCQAILAHLETTDQIPLSHSQVATPVAASQHSKTRVPRPSFRPRWRWLAPAGAMAAGLLVWIALHENQPPRLQLPSEVKTAKVERPSATPPLATVPAGTPSPNPALIQPYSAQQRSRESASLDQKVAGEKKASADEELSRQNKELSATLRKPSSQIAVPERGRAGALRDAAKASRNDKDQGAAVGALAQSVTVEAAKPESDALTAADAQVQIQTQAANLPVQNRNVSPAVPGPAPLGQATGAMKAKAAPAAPPPAPTKSARNLMTSESVEVVSVTDPRLILAPASSIRWRVGPAGLIQFSANSGASWSRQASGVLADLLTGSAPSDKVCWIVGRLGAILLTTDGGAHWKLLSSPMKDELGRVQASDALHARIWNSLNTKSFETSDGGVTWKRFENE